MPQPKEISTEDLDVFLSGCGGVKTDLNTVVTALRRKYIHFDVCMKTFHNVTGK